MNTMDQTQANLSAVLGRQLPYSVENEQALLGALILDSERIGEVTALLTPDDFYIEKHGQIFSALIQLSAESRGVDVVTLLTTLVKNGVYTEESGSAYVRQLAENVPSLTNLMDYAAIIHDKALLRSLIRACEESMQESYDQAEDTEKIIDRAEQRIYSLSQGAIKQDFSKIDVIIQQFYAELQVLASGKDTGSIQTYFSDIDRLLVGMNPGDFILIGARPGMGKTSFALNIAAEVAKKRKDKAVAIFSLEMSKTQLASRLLSSEGGIDSRKLRDGQLAEEDYANLTGAAVALSETNIYIDDSSNITPMQMRTKLRRIKNLGLVILDYLQLMHSDRKIDNRVLEVAEITRSLKIMAKELGCPIIACSQLARISSDRKDKRPQLTDLRDSGAIEQDADVVMFLHRDFYYDNQNTEVQNLAECIIAKNRHGEPGTVKLGFDGSHTRFLTLTKQYDNIPTE